MDIFSDVSTGGSNPFTADPLTVPPSSILNLIIHSQIPVTLKLLPPNFTLWLTLFDALINSYGLADHVDGFIDAQQLLSDTTCTQLNWCIMRWIYGMISEDIISTIRVNRPNAYILFQVIHTLFRGNRHQQGVQALEEFHGPFQGHSSV